MIVKVVRSGGFAGIKEELGAVDTSGLDAAGAAQVRNHVAELERLVAKLGDQAIGADLFRYDIEIRDDQGRARHLVLMHEGDPGLPLPAPLAGLLNVIAGSR